MFRPMQEPPQTSGCFEQAEAFMKQFAKDAGLLIYSAGGDTACPWLMHPSGDRVVAYHGFDKDRPWVCWHRGQPPHSIPAKSHAILLFLLTGKIN